MGRSQLPWMEGTRPITQSANSQDLRPARAVAQNRIWRKKSVVIFSLAQLAIRFVGGKFPDRPFGPVPSPASQIQVPKNLQLSQSAYDLPLLQ